MFEIELFVCIKIDLAVINLQVLFVGWLDFMALQPLLVI